jgi:2-oxo-4-hydroxy-4-carboxy-5-ureidoimidazoline decarboxylase
MERWQRIDEASDARAAGELRVCCGSPLWVERMLPLRPFGSLEAARTAARDVWFALPAEEWKIAFGHHPRIGDVEAVRAKFGGASAAREQAGVTGADVSVLRALVDANREYEARFGYIFIVCATGQTAGQLLDILRSRLRNDPADEILIAAREHAKITDLRLAATV